MTTLKQKLNKLYDRDCFGYMRVVRPEEVLEAVKEWLQQKHKDWIEQIQYEEMFIEEVIPRLLEELSDGGE